MTPSALWRWAAPVVLYTLGFCVLTYPAIAEFNSLFFADTGDGYQCVWDLWWVDYALKAGQNPWFTTLLEFPHGTNLLPQTMNPFNGFMVTVMRPLLSLVQAHNVVVMFCFVVGGMTAYRLALHLTGHVIGSLLAGWVYTFSSYHFAHAEGHLQLVALEWLPFFLLQWWQFCRTPTPLRGGAAAAALLLVQLCDYYYFFFCVIAGAVLWLHTCLSRRRDRPWQQRPWWLAHAAFVATAGVLCGPLALGVIWLDHTDPLLGSHPAWEYALDLFAPFIPGGHWRFAAMTRGYWRQLPGNIHESSVYWGWGAIVLMVVGYRNRQRLALLLTPWAWVLGVFFALALGPQVRGFGVALVPGPYALAAKVFPPLDLSGCPVRMSVILTLCVGLGAAAGVRALWTPGRRRWALLAMGLVAVETLPKPIPLSPAVAPPFIAAMADLPRGYGVFDVDGVLGNSQPLFYQTVHGLPMVHGYISRTPTSVARKNRALTELARQNRWQELCEQLGVRYVILPGRHPRPGILATLSPTLSAGDAVALYDLGGRFTCADKVTTDAVAVWEHRGR